METDESPQHYSRSVIVAGLITALLTLLVIVHYRQISGRTGTIVLPAGGTYLGPSNQPSSANKKTDVSKDLGSGAGTVNSSPSTKKGYLTIKGNKYPYAFEVPESVKLTTFPDDVYDVYAIAREGVDPYSAVLIGVDDLTRDAKKSVYIQKPLTDYVNDWWKQFGGLKGVSSLSEFTNGKGLKGVKAKFVNGSSDDIFFASPDAKHIIHLANGPLGQKIFEAIVDSVTWEK